MTFGYGSKVEWMAAAVWSVILRGSETWSLRLDVRRLGGTNTVVYEALVERGDRIL